MGDSEKMKPKRRVLGLIPARHGSKGIIGKNTRLMCGKPLLEWTIEAGLGASCLTNLILSTDSPEALKIAEKFPIEVPFQRPDDISGDQSKTKDVVKHALDFLSSRGRQFTDVVLLQPTSPIRDASDIQRAWEIYQGSGANTLISVCRADKFASHFMYFSKFGGEQKFEFLQGASESSMNPIRRQEVSPLWWRNGAIYIFQAQKFLESDEILNNPIVGYEMSWNRSVNIDDESDWKLAEHLLSQELRSLRNGS